MMRQFKAGKRRVKPHHFRALLWIAALIVGGYTIQQVKHEGTVRKDQFCELVFTSHAEKLKALEQTEEFIETPNAALPDSLIDLKHYVRTISLPQQKREVLQGRANIPEVCLE